MNKSPLLSPSVSGYFPSLNLARFSSPAWASGENSIVGPIYHSLFHLGL